MYFSGFEFVQFRGLCDFIFFSFEQNLNSQKITSLTLQNVAEALFSTFVAVLGENSKTISEFDISILSPFIYLLSVGSYSGQVEVTDSSPWGRIASPSSRPPHQRRRPFRDEILVLHPPSQPPGSSPLRRHRLQVALRRGQRSSRMRLCLSVKTRQSLETVPVKEKRSLRFISIL